MEQTSPGFLIICLTYIALGGDGKMYKCINRKRGLQFGTYHNIMYCDRKNRIKGVHIC